MQYSDSYPLSVMQHISIRGPKTHIIIKHRNLALLNITRMVKSIIFANETCLQWMFSYYEQFVGRAVSCLHGGWLTVCSNITTRSRDAKVSKPVSISRHLENNFWSSVQYGHMCTQSFTAQNKQKTRALHQEGPAVYRIWPNFTESGRIWLGSFKEIMMPVMLSLLSKPKKLVNTFLADGFESVKYAA